MRLIAVGCHGNNFRRVPVADVNNGASATSKYGKMVHPHPSNQATHQTKYKKHANQPGDRDSMITF